MIPSESFEGRSFQPAVDVDIARCSACGDVLSDQEIIYYGIGRHELYFGKLFKGFCAFCYEPDSLDVDFFCDKPKRKPILFWRIFKNSDYQIFNLKRKLRDVIYSSPKVKQLKRHLSNLEDKHYDEIFPQKYTEEINYYRDDHTNTSEELQDQMNIPRLAYNSCLGKYGASGSDQAPTIRNITGRQKRALVKALKKELEIIERNYRCGFYD